MLAPILGVEVFLHFQRQAELRPGIALGCMEEEAQLVLLIEN